MGSGCPGVGWSEACGSGVRWSELWGSWWGCLGVGWLRGLVGWGRGGLLWLELGAGALARAKPQEG